MVFKKIIFQNRYVALETPSRLPPLHGKYHLKFPFWLLAPFPYLSLSLYLISCDNCDYVVWFLIKSSNTHKVHSMQTPPWILTKPTKLLAGMWKSSGTSWAWSSAWSTTTTTRPRSRRRAPTPTTSRSPRSKLAPPVKRAGTFTLLLARTPICSIQKCRLSQRSKLTAAKEVKRPSWRISSRRCAEFILTNMKSGWKVVLEIWNSFLWYLA